MTTPSRETTPARRRPRHLLRWSLVGIVALLLLAECFARFYLGLGDPPLMMVDPQIEYLAKPGTYHRFGNRISYNAFSMRSGPITPHKTDPAELRVLVIGDSVINGGSQTDDSQVFTSLLQSRLAASLHRPVYVGNISAGSWGPPNELAYLQKFGLFDADCLVLVVSSHDYADAPDFNPIVGISPSFPSHRPISALQEGITRYLIPRITHSQDPPDPGTVAPKTPDKKDVDWCLDATRQIIRLGHDHGFPVIVAQHAERGELNPGTPEPVGHVALGNAIRDEQTQPVQLGPAFRQDLDAGHNPYRDYIHPNPEGQRLIADTLYPLILQDLQDRINHPTTTQPAH